MLQSEPALLTIFRVRLRGELDAENLLDGHVIVEDEGGATIIAAADPDAERKLGSMEIVETIERIGRAILVPEKV
jgi:hypothetical protein